MASELQQPGPGGRSRGRPRAPLQDRRPPAAAGGWVGRGHGWGPDADPGRASSGAHRRAGIVGEPGALPRPDGGLGQTQTRVRRRELLASSGV